mmetsp:Transcript_67993/g.195177  ORF Transcript_67993/g.195177 Transcript_67993/m.195177 type:complete len:417 (-) Transcript_67993:307-1557(-)
MHGGGMHGGGMHGGGMHGGAGVQNGGFVNGGCSPTGGAIMTTGGANSGGGSACGAGGCFTESANAGSMAFVGVGFGDWVTETTYKYVGGGRGDLSIVTPTKRNFMPCLALVALLVLGVVGVLLVATPAPTTTMKAVVDPQPQAKECVFWGDPHVVTFDGGRPSFYGDGEYWIVRNDLVKIQGRFMGTKYTFGLAATQKVAVGGPFIGNHVIEVEPMEKEFGGSILVDGEPVLAQYGTYSVGGVATLTYDGVGELPDMAASQWTKNIVHMYLPQGVSLTVYRWGNYLDLRIKMPPLRGGQDGSCGNFNGDATDDTTAEIFKRIGARVGTSDMLFSKRAEVSFTVEEMQMLREHCSPQMIVEGELECRKELGQNASTTQVNACVFDVCFGMNEHALRSAEVYSTAEERDELGIVKAEE